MSATPRDTSAPVADVIDSAKVYSIRSLREQLGLGAAAVRSMRRKGLPVRRVGRASYVYGSDLISYIVESCPVVGPDGSLSHPGSCSSH